METTCSFIDGNTLYECINNKIDVDRILAHIEKMNQWHRYTGTPDGEAFVDDLIKQNNQTTTSNFPCNFNFAVSNMNRFNQGIYHG